MKKVIFLISGQSGLSLIELIVTMLIVVIVLTMNTSTLGVALKQSKQQMQAAGSEMDKIAGLGVLRFDVEHAGYGLPWSFSNPAAISYAEAAGGTEAGYNDSPSTAPCAVKTGNGTGVNGSDYLVVKSTIVGNSMTALKWNSIVFPSTTVGTSGSPNTFTVGERAIVLWANVSAGIDKQLIMNGSTTFVNITDAVGTIPVNFRPVTTPQSYMVYGVDPGTNLRMPFNRADYYIAQPADMPQGCAPGTGVLYKATVNHSDGGLTRTVLLDCVADFQVAFGLDTNGDGVVDAHTNDISALLAQDIRTQVKEARLYILSHEGTIDKAFNFNNGNATTIRVGHAGLGLGRDFNFPGTIGTDWKNYRWKLDVLTVRTTSIIN